MGTKTLFIIRHAKSDWSLPAVDSVRPLMPSGVEDAGMVAAEAKKIIGNRYIIWSSTARRAADTASIFASVVEYPLEDIIMKDSLYTFECRALENEIRKCDDNHSTLIVFGHNEAITDFVNKFGHIHIDNVPTSALVEITFETNHWASIAPGRTGRVILPRDLRS